MSLPFTLWAVIFIVLPLCLIVWYGVTLEIPVEYTQITLEDGSTAYKLEDGTVQTQEPWQKKAVISFSNFKRMVEPTYLKLLIRSLRVALLTTLICLLLGYPVALILTGKDFKHPSLWMMLIILPMWMNFLLRTYSWMSILENSGILNSWIASLREAFPAFDKFLSDRGVGNKIIFLYNENAVILGMVYNYRAKSITIAWARKVQTIYIGDVIQNQFGKSSDWHFGASLSLLVMVVVLAFMRGLHSIDKEEEVQKEVRIF